MTDILTSNMGCEPILSVNVSIKKIKGAAHKNGDVNSTWKQSLKVCLHVTDFSPFY